MEQSSFFRRLGAIAYDIFLIFTCLIFSTLIWVILNNKAVSQDNILLLRIYCLSVIYLFFIWFWVKRGQTLGMLAWKIKLVDQYGSTVNVSKASIRLFYAILFSLPCGLTYIWMLLDPESITLHDRLSKTYMVKTTH